MKYVLVLACAVCVVFASCSARLEGVLSADGSAEVSLNARIEPKMAALLTTLSSFAAEPTRAPTPASGAAGSTGAAGPSSAAAAAAPANNLVDGPSISRSLRNAPGIKSASLANTDGRSLEGSISIAQVDRFLRASTAGALSGTPSAGRLLRYERSSAGGLLVLSLDRASGPDMLLLVSPDVSDYLSALMAPVATGEELSKQDYLALVSSVYGKGIASEIADAQVSLDLELPGTVLSAPGGTFSGRRASFKVPLTDLLVLERPLLYEIRWKN